MRHAAIAFLATVLLGCAAAQERAPGATAVARPIAIPDHFDAADLNGLAANDVSRLLGAPGLLRNEGPAQVWQYADQTCILDLFLYNDGSRHVVRYAEARAPRLGDRARPDMQACLDAILADRRLTS